MKKLLYSTIFILFITLFITACKDDIINISNLDNSSASESVFESEISQEVSTMEESQIEFVPKSDLPELSDEEIINAFKVNQKLFENSLSFWDNLKVSSGTISIDSNNEIYYVIDPSAVYNHVDNKKLEDEIREFMIKCNLRNIQGGTDEIVYIFYRPSYSTYITYTDLFLYADELGAIQLADGWWFASQLKGD